MDRGSSLFEGSIHSFASVHAESCPALCDPMDCSLPGSSVHGVFQARILKWVAISYSQPRIKPMSPAFPAWKTGSFTTIPVASPTPSSGSL